MIRCMILTRLTLKLTLTSTEPTHMRRCPATGHGRPWLNFENCIFELKFFPRGERYIRVAQNSHSQKGGGVNSQFYIFGTEL